MNQKIVLCILDGWGVGPKDDTNPIYTSDLKTIKYMEDNFPSGALKSSGIAVGLPWGEEGNSEVGHLTIGAGRTLYQHFMKITHSIESGDFFKNEALLNAFQHSKENNSSTHLIGLLTKGNIHASLSHIKALLKMAKDKEVENVYLHLFTDGRDSSPKGAKEFITELKQAIGEIGVGNIADISGRYWAMDRDRNWDRTEKVYKALFGQAQKGTIDQALEDTYKKDLNDEYVEPTILEEFQPIRDGDSLIFFNFREDRIKQLAEPFLNDEFGEFPVSEINNVKVTTMTEYFEDFKSEVVFKKDTIKNTLGEVLSKNKKTQLRISESVKSPHITYFFNGLKESPFENEFRVSIPSEKIGRPDESPGMMARPITDRVISSLREGTFDFILINYANPDVIAHTGNYKATMEAVKVIDAELNRLVREVLNSDHVLMVTSDHGNAESVFDLKTGQPETKHNANPVPFYLVSKKHARKNNTNNLESVGVLSDIAPTILSIMGIEKPEEMTGTNLLDIL
ncbi:MAG: 2,3-bisphosphoglycerate-independent phosphoglycerate mutase [Candidatus Paceibacterota bacterium]